ncbi:MAG TPA: 2-oxoacid:acceptor oxidoreductase family protein [Rectinemataceae bacterium]|nr:2-oxoacid:acceptor oxidoreductase family protein [Rectinemataceae bacterium]
MSGVYNIYMTGVGGQGIGLLSELLARAAAHAGLAVKGCDTHGLAQRGGIVSSHLRLGQGAHSPLVEAGSADLVVALERCEALRALRTMLAPSGVLLWYDASWQPLDVRLGKEGAVRTEEVFAEASAREVSARRVFKEDLEDPRQQNVALVADIARAGLIPGVGLEHYRAALADLLDGDALAKNIAVLEEP